MPISSVLHNVHRARSEDCVVVLTSACPPSVDGCTQCKSFRTRVKSLRLSALGVPCTKRLESKSTEFKFCYAPRSESASVLSLNCTAKRPRTCNNAVNVRQSQTKSDNPQERDKTANGELGAASLSDMGTLTRCSAAAGCPTLELEAREGVLLSSGLYLVGDGRNQL